MSKLFRKLQICTLRDEIFIDRDNLKITQREGTQHTEL